MKDRNLKLFYLHEMLFRFSDSMLLLILPIFIYQLYDSISVVFMFIAIWNIIHGILFIPVFNLAMKWKHPKYFMILGILFYIVSLFMLGKITPGNTELVIPATITFSLYLSFYWMVKHWFISVNTSYEKIGKQMSIASIIRTVISFIGPLTAGFISYYFSFGSTFILGAAFGMASIIPIALFDAPPHKEKYDLKKVISILKKPRIKAITPAYISEGAGFVMILNGWLLAFTIFIGNILDLGILVGATTFITAIMVWTAGKWFDKRKRKKILKRSTGAAMISALLYSTIFFLPNIAYIAFVEFMNRISFTTHITVLESYLYGYGNKIDPVEFPMARELYLNLGRLISSTFLAIAFYFLPAEYLWVTISIGAFTYLGHLTLLKNDYLLTDSKS